MFKLTDAEELIYEIIEMRKFLKAKRKARRNKRREKRLKVLTNK